MTNKKAIEKAREYLDTGRFFYEGNRLIEDANRGLDLIRELLPHIDAQEKQPVAHLSSHDGKPYVLQYDQKFKPGLYRRIGEGEL